MRTFQLIRIEDVGGISGVGLVAEGIQFSNGKCVLVWTTKLQSIAMYDSLDDLMAIHGHEGKTKLVFTLPDIENAAS